MVRTWAVSSLCWRWIHLQYMVGIYRGSYFIVYFPLHLHQFSLLVKVVFNVGFATRCAVSIKHWFFVSCTSHATIHPPQIIKTTTQRWVDIATATEKNPNTIVEYRLWNTNTCILGRMYLTVKYIFKYLRGFNLFGYFNACALWVLQLMTFPYFSKLCMVVADFWSVQINNVCLFSWVVIIAAFTI